MRNDAIIRQRLDITDVINKLIGRKRGLKWVGHVLMMSQHRLSNQALHNNSTIPKTITTAIRWRDHEDLSMRDFMVIYCLGATCSDLTDILGFEYSLPKAINCAEV